MNSATKQLALTPAALAALPRQSFEALYEAHFDFVWRSLRRLGVMPAVVEDAAQDTFVVVHRRLADLRPDASAKAWVFSIAMRVASDYRRAHRRKHAESFDADSAPSQDSGPFEGTLKAQAARVLEAFLATLDDDKRAVFVLAELEELSAPEIGEALGSNVNTVYSRLRLARERFVAFIASNGGRHG